MSQSTMTLLLQVFTLLLPVLVSILSLILQQDHFSEKENGLIAGASLVLAGVVTAFLQGKLTGDVYGDMGIVLAVCVALQAGTFLPLAQYFRSITSVSSSVGSPEPVAALTPILPFAAGAPTPAVPATDKQPTAVMTPVQKEEKASK